MKRTRSGNWLRVAPVLIAFWSICSPREASALPYTSTVVGTGSNATLSSPFENFPNEGAVPLDLEIHNDHDQAAVFTVDFEGEAREPVTSLTCHFKVEPHAAGKFVIDLPLSLKMAYGYVSMRPTISGPGIGETFEPITLSRGGAGEGLLSAISNSIYGKVDWTAKATDRQSHSKTAFNVTSIDTSKLPANWQGLCGLGSLMMTDADWLALSTDQRAAVLDFVAMGGRLALFMKSESAAQPAVLRLPIPTPGSMPRFINYDFHYGSGYIGLEPKKDLADISDPELEGLIVSWVRKSQEESASGYTGSSWSIGNEVGRVAVNAPLIIIIVLSFSTLVGPINLIYFAPANQRIRLFWTTPLISVAASAILLFGILVGDGLGGKGRQAMVICSLPHMNQEVVLQEQAARTAVLMSTAWQNLDDALVLQIPQESTTYSGANFSDDNFHVAGQEMTGNWFKSRAISWQFMRAVRPSRSQLLISNLKEVIAGKEDPKLVSSFPDILKEVHITIGTKCWVAKNVPPGASTKASSEMLEDRKAFFQDCRDQVGVWLKEALKNPETTFNDFEQPLAPSETFFMATAEPDDRQALRSLEAIRWQVDEQIYVGQMVDQEESGHE